MILILIFAEVLGKSFSQATSFSGMLINTRDRSVRSDCRPSDELPL